MSSPLDRVSTLIIQSLNGTLYPQLFDTLRSIDPEETFRHKVHAIEGDIALDEFGIKAKDQEMMKENINIVIHSAATINFNDPIE